MAGIILFLSVMLLGALFLALFPNSISGVKSYEDLLKRKKRVEESKSTSYQLMHWTLTMVPPPKLVVFGMTLFRTVAILMSAAILNAMIWVVINW